MIIRRNATKKDILPHRYELYTYSVGGAQYREKVVNSRAQNAGRKAVDRPGAEIIWHHGGVAIRQQPRKGVSLYGAFEIAWAAKERPCFIRTEIPKAEE